MSFFKSASNYKEFSYFTCENNKKKSKEKGNKRICYAHIKIDLENKNAEMTKLHEDECLIKTYGNNTIIPSMNNIIKNRDDILDFGDKILASNSGISLTTFKQIIYRYTSIKKYELNLTEEYIIFF